MMLVGRFAGAVKKLSKPVWMRDLLAWLLCRFTLMLMSPSKEARRGLPERRQHDCGARGLS